MLVRLIEWITLFASWAAELFGSSPTIVRVIDHRKKKYVYGRVMIESHREAAVPEGRVTHWTVIWDDEPAMWLTYPSHEFAWFEDVWTKAER